MGSLAHFGGYRGSTSVRTPRAPGWVTFFATAARPRNIHLDRALGGCQHERNINGRAGRGPVSIFLKNRSESVHQQQSPAPWRSCSRGRLCERHDRSHFACGQTLADFCEVCTIKLSHSGGYTPLYKASDRPITSSVVNDTFSDEAKNTEVVPARFLRLFQLQGKSVDAV